MAQLSEHKSDLFRLGATLAMLFASVSGVWKAIAPFDFVALAATIIAGYPVFREAFEAIKRRKMSMELSMAIAVVATLIIGQFFTGLVIVFFVLAAELLEELTLEGGRDVINNIVGLLPNRAHVRRNATEQDINISELRLDDIVIVKPGSRIPVDGIVLEGASFVNQASITGESLPVEKTAGADVLAGTINQNGVLEVQPRRIGKETIFGKIIEIIEQAEQTKAPIERIADKLAARLVYFAFAGGLITFGLTHNIVFAISALIVAGACGVAAGTPLAILAGVGRLAKEGIIVKGGVYLEQLGAVDTVVLDKTGTLTMGDSQVIQIKSFNGMHPDAILRYAASAELHSEHPLARTILEEARVKNIAVPKYSSVDYLPGRGIAARVNGDEIVLGTAMLMNERAMAGGANNDYLSRSSEETGMTEVFVAINGTIAGVVQCADVLRPEAVRAIQKLHTLGCETIVLSGDSPAVANSIGKELGVNQVFAGMIPQQKLEKIRELKGNGKKIAMVGDGVNDAPALIESDVGIAMGSGTALALECADMALVTNNLDKIVSAFRISRQCMNVIRFNFWGTIVVDVVGVALAPFGLLTPLIATLIHVGSETAFILNSARLFNQKQVMT